MSTTESIARGAKQLVVLVTQRIFSPNLVRASFMPSTSVYNSSPTRISSITIGFKLAAVMAFKQVFWSILDQTTYSPAGLRDFKVNSVIVIAIPVANGSTITS